MISNPKDYLDALRRFEEIFQAPPGSTESDEADLLAESIKAYEDKNFMIAAPNQDRVG